MSGGLPYNAPFEAQFDPNRSLEFIISRLIRQVHTVMLVQVLAVRPTAGKVGFLDCQPLVLQQDTNGQALAQSPIFNVPYLRVQGGASAIIMDPAIGDRGLALFAERDIRNVKANAAAALAASDRAYSSADALYIGGVLNPDPTQWVKFLPGAAGIDVNTPGALTAEAASLQATISGPAAISATGNVQVTAGGTAKVQSTGTLTLQAPLIVLQGTIQLAGAVSQTAGGGSGSASFQQPLQAPDFQAPNANLNTHDHTVSGIQTGSGSVVSGPPHN